MREARWWFRERRRRSPPRRARIPAASSRRSSAWWRRRADREASARGGGPDPLPGSQDIGALRLPLTDREPERVPAAEHRVSQVDIACGVDALEQLAVPDIE